MDYSWRELVPILVAFDGAIDAVQQAIVESFVQSVVQKTFDGMVANGDELQEAFHAIVFHVALPSAVSSTPPSCLQPLVTCLTKAFADQLLQLLQHDGSGSLVLVEELDMERILAMSSIGDVQIRTFSDENLPPVESYFTSTSLSSTAGKQSVIYSDQWMKQQRKRLKSIMKHVALNSTELAAFKYLDSDNLGLDDIDFASNRPTFPPNSSVNPDHYEQSHSHSANVAASHGKNNGNNSTWSNDNNERNDIIDQFEGDRSTQDSWFVRLFRFLLLTMLDVDNYRRQIAAIVIKSIFLGLQHSTSTYPLSNTNQMSTVPSLAIPKYLAQDVLSLGLVVLALDDVVAFQDIEPTILATTETTFASPTQTITAMKKLFQYPVKEEAAQLVVQGILALYATHSATSNNQLEEEKVQLIYTHTGFQELLQMITVSTNPTTGKSQQFQSIRIGGMLGLLLCLQQPSFTNASETINLRIFREIIQPLALSHNLIDGTNNQMNMNISHQRALYLLLLDYFELIFQQLSVSPELLSNHCAYLEEIMMSLYQLLQYLLPLTAKSIQSNSNNFSDNNDDDVEDILNVFIRIGSVLRYIVAQIQEIIKLTNSISLARNLSLLIHHYWSFYPSLWQGRYVWTKTALLMFRYFCVDLFNIRTSLQNSSCSTGGNNSINQQQNNAIWFCLLQNINHKTEDEEAETKWFYAVMSLLVMTMISASTVDSILHLQDMLSNNNSQNDDDGDAYDTTAANHHAKSKSNSENNSVTNGTNNSLIQWTWIGKHMVQYMQTKSNSHSDDLVREYLWSPMVSFVTSAIPNNSNSDHNDSSSGHNDEQQVPLQWYQVFSVSLSRLLPSEFQQQTNNFLLLSPVFLEFVSTSASMLSIDKERPLLQQIFDPYLSFFQSQRNNILNNNAATNNKHASSSNTSETAVNTVKKTKPKFIIAGAAAKKIPSSNNTANVNQRQHETHNRQTAMMSLPVISWSLFHMQLSLYIHNSDHEKDHTSTILYLQQATQDCAQLLTSLAPCFTKDEHNGLSPSFVSLLESSLQIIGAFDTGGAMSDNNQLISEIVKRTITKNNLLSKTHSSNQTVKEKASSNSHNQVMQTLLVLLQLWHEQRLVLSTTNHCSNGSDCTFVETTLAILRDFPINYNNGYVNCPQSSPMLGNSLVWSTVQPSLQMCFFHQEARFNEQLLWTWIQQCLQTDPSEITKNNDTTSNANNSDNSASSSSSSSSSSIQYWIQHRAYSLLTCLCPSVTPTRWLTHITSAMTTAVTTATESHPMFRFVHFLLQLLLSSNRNAGATNKNNSNNCETVSVADVTNFIAWIFTSALLPSVHGLQYHKQQQEGQVSQGLYSLGLTLKLLLFAFNSNNNNNNNPDNSKANTIFNHIHNVNEMTTQRNRRVVAECCASLTQRLHVLLASSFAHITTITTTTTTDDKNTDIAENNNKSVVSLSVYDVWISMAIQGLADSDNQVRQHALTMFQTLVPLAPLGFQPPSAAVVQQVQSDAGSSASGNKMKNAAAAAAATVHSNDEENSADNVIATDNVWKEHQQVSIRQLLAKTHTSSFLDSTHVWDQKLLATLHSFLRFSNKITDTIGGNHCGNSGTFREKKQQLSAFARKYQWEAVQWWTSLRRCGLGGILADEMGLGKTLQALLCLAILRLEISLQQNPDSYAMDASSSSANNNNNSINNNNNISNNSNNSNNNTTTTCSKKYAPLLILCPASLTFHWQAEIHKYFQLAVGGGGTNQKLFSPCVLDAKDFAAVVAAATNSNKKQKSTYTSTSNISSHNSMNDNIACFWQQMFRDYDVFILSYDTFRRYASFSTTSSTSNSTTISTSNSNSTVNSFSFFSYPTWQCLVLDEAHIIRNPGTLLHQLLTNTHEKSSVRSDNSDNSRNIPAITAQYRLALTGTPLQNQVEDVYALMHFLVPGYLGDYRTFRQKYVKPVQQSTKALRWLKEEASNRYSNSNTKAHSNDTSNRNHNTADTTYAINTNTTNNNTNNSNNNNVATTSSSNSQQQQQQHKQHLLRLSAQGIALLHHLHRLILPFLLRRHKRQVLQELPSKTIVDVLCPLTRLQRNWYRSFQQQILGVLPATVKQQMKAAYYNTDTHGNTNANTLSDEQSDAKNDMNIIGKKRTLAAVNNDRDPSDNLYVREDEELLDQQLQEAEKQDQQIHAAVLALYENTVFAADNNNDTSSSNKVHAKRAQGNDHEEEEEKQGEEEEEEEDGSDIFNLQFATTAPAVHNNVVNSSSDKNDSSSVSSHPFHVLSCLQRLAIHPSLVIDAALHPLYHATLQQDVMVSGKFMQLIWLLYETGFLSLSNEYQTTGSYASKDNDDSSNILTTISNLHNSSSHGQLLSKWLAQIEQTLNFADEDNQEGDVHTNPMVVDEEEEEEGEEDHNDLLPSNTMNMDDDSSDSDSDNHDDNNIATSKNKNNSSDNNVPKAVSQAKKCLIFAQHSATLDVLETCVLQPLGILPYDRSTNTSNNSTMYYGRLDGSMKPAERYRIATLFSPNTYPDTDASKSNNATNEISILLLTTRACGLGLNLTAADTVFFLEHDWNPAQDLQAMDRVHRLGQQYPVMIYRLLSADTVEERLMHIQYLKQDIAARVVLGSEFTSNDSGQHCSSGERETEQWGKLLWESLTQNEQLFK